MNLKSNVPSFHFLTVICKYLFLLVVLTVSDFFAIFELKKRMLHKFALSTEWLQIRNKITRMQLKIIIVTIFCKYT